MNPLHGLMPILATPFDASGNVDLPSFRRLLDFQLAAGVDGVAVGGMASETFALTAHERGELLRAAVQAVGDEVIVVSGVNATSTVTAIEQAKAATDDGAAALMVLPPYMVKPTPGQLVDFYGEVATATPTPVMVQDAPGVTGVPISPPVVSQLAALPGVTSIKVEAPPTAPKVAAVVGVITDPDFTVVGGQNAQFCLDEYARGAVGTMPACEFPDLLKPILDQWCNGAQAEARANFAQLLPLIIYGLQSGPAWAIHKEVLVARGIIDTATVRLPAQPLDAATGQGLQQILDNLSLPPLG